jgi:hypothetical protein
VESFPGAYGWARSEVGRALGGEAQSLVGGGDRRGGAAVPVCCPGSVKAGVPAAAPGQLGAQGMLSSRGQVVGPWG